MVALLRGFYSVPPEFEDATPKPCPPIARVAGPAARRRPRLELGRVEMVIINGIPVSGP